MHVKRKSTSVKVVSALAILVTAGAPTNRAFAAACAPSSLPTAGTGCVLSNQRAADLTNFFGGTPGPNNEWTSAGLRPVVDGTRIVAAAGDKRLRVLCLRDSSNDSGCQATIKEEARDSTFVTQLKTIFKGIAGAGSGADVASETVLEVVYQCLSLPRATVTIEKQANAADTTPAKDCPTAKTWDVMLDRRATSASKDSTVTLLTGPVEHAFISASVPVKHLSELKYDSTNKTIVESQQPSSFFVGINYAWGDVLTAHPWSEAYKGLFASVMLDASKTPWQRFGVAGGWRLMKLGDSLDLSALTVFVGRVWNKGDRLTRPDGSKIGARYPGQLQYGVGFNANKIVDWFKKSS